MSAPSDGPLRDLRRGVLRGALSVLIALLTLWGEHLALVSALTFGVVWVPLTLLEGAAERRRPRGRQRVGVAALCWVVVAGVGFGVLLQQAYLGGVVFGGLGPVEALAHAKLGRGLLWLALLVLVLGPLFSALTLARIAEGSTADRLTHGLNLLIAQLGLASVVIVVVVRSWTPHADAGSWGLLLLGVLMFNAAVAVVLALSWLAVAALDDLEEGIWPRELTE